MEHYISIAIFALSVFLVGIQQVRLSTLKLKLENLKRKNHDLESAVKTRPQSIELKEFLTDLNQKGYGMVRIDPDTLMQISPHTRG